LKRPNLTKPPIGFSLITEAFAIATQKVATQFCVLSIPFRTEIAFDQKRIEKQKTRSWNPRAG
jgi:hypothetical protein